MHLLGLVSYGGVHSHLDHLQALLELARREGMAERTWIHAFTDGATCPRPRPSRDLAELPPGGSPPSSGRYYAMDRDERWERIERALAAIVAARATRGADPVERCGELRAGVTDEFVEPIVLAGAAADPATPRSSSTSGPTARGSSREHLLEPGFDVTTMTRYRDDFPCPVAFPEQEVRDTLAEVLADARPRQLHVAETEKYAHVTYFFNGGDEREWPGEERDPRPLAARRRDATT